MQFVHPDFKGENPGHYSPAVKVGNLMFVSGQLSIDPDTREVCRGDIKDHARLALNNLDRVLKAAGCTKDDVVLCRVYIPDVCHWDAVNAVYGAFFGAHKPARVIVPTRELHNGAMVEIEAAAGLHEQ